MGAIYGNRSSDDVVPRFELGVARRRFVPSKADKIIS